MLCHLSNVCFLPIIGRELYTHSGLTRERQTRIGRTHKQFPDRAQLLQRLMVGAEFRHTEEELNTSFVREVGCRLPGQRQEGSNTEKTGGQE